MSKEDTPAPVDAKPMAVIEIIGGNRISVVETYDMVIEKIEVAEGETAHITLTQLREGFPSRLTLNARAIIVIYEMTEDQWRAIEAEHERMAQEQQGAPGLQVFGIGPV